MKTIIALFLLASLAIARADTNSVTTDSRIWTFKKGGKFDGRVADFRGTNEVLMVFAKDQKQYAIIITLLIDEDQKILRELRPTFEMRASAKILANEGYVELTAKLMQNFPEKVDEKRGWLDGEFRKIDNSDVRIYLKDFERDALGFSVRDKNGDIFHYCFANKNGELRTGLENELLALKAGDKIRVKGKVVSMHTDNEWLYADSIEVLQKSKE